MKSEGVLFGSVVKCSVENAAGASQFLLKCVDRQTWNEVHKPIALRLHARQKHDRSKQRSRSSWYSYCYSVATLGVASKVATESTPAALPVHAVERQTSSRSIQDCFVTTWSSSSDDIPPKRRNTSTTSSPSIPSCSPALPSPW